MAASIPRAVLHIHSFILYLRKTFSILAVFFYGNACIIMQFDLKVFICVKVCMFSCFDLLIQKQFEILFKPASV